MTSVTPATGARSGLRTVSNFRIRKAGPFVAALREWGGNLFPLAGLNIGEPALKLVIATSLRSIIGDQAIPRTRFPFHAFSMAVKRTLAVHPLGRVPAFKKSQPDVNWQVGTKLS